MDLKEVINKLEELTVADIVDFLCKNNISLEVFNDAIKRQRPAEGWGSAEKRNNVKALLKQKDDYAYKTAVVANTVEAFQRYLSLFPNGNHASEAREKIQTLNYAANADERKRGEYERKLREIEDNINKYDIEDISNEKDPDKYLSDEILSEILKRKGYDKRGVTVKMIRACLDKENEVKLSFSALPQNQEEIPDEYTDVFFWGLPSSGKTCALAAIFNTIEYAKNNENNNKFVMEAPDCKTKFGTIYRENLINIFDNNWGYLPGRTNKDQTQYMPFLLSRRGEKEKHKISFFELSGEVIKFFHQKTSGKVIIKENDKSDIEKAFTTLDLLLKSDNQKIHFFFIDYNKETTYKKDDKGLTQSNYLNAAATYFRDTNDIFAKKTTAIYIVITKSDEIKGDNASEIKNNATKFLQNNFGNFLALIDEKCKTYSIKRKTKLFSIGDVIFKNLCLINREYSEDIIEDLLEHVKPVNNSRFFKIGRKFANS